jgi:hypothetical protein
MIASSGNGDCCSSQQRQRHGLRFAHGVGGWLYLTNGPRKCSRNDERQRNADLSSGAIQCSFALRTFP